ncbi:hypothetical protein Bpfe_031263 [Biomphalaria pfeifferi]|uniref:Uncharacterized protein n=1 Tax=Biomphalaria pfeifferi TaxID=112525 RepID=A0AAD8ETF7_BIOPF|nr:hypothetical protein Bpfe_031263 [Biomphalaria pfeifferi]
MPSTNPRQSRRDQVNQWRRRKAKASRELGNGASGSHGVWLANRRQGLTQALCTAVFADPRLCVACLPLTYAVSPVNLDRQSAPLALGAAGTCGVRSWSHLACCT